MLYRTFLEANSVEDILTRHFKMKAWKLFLWVVLLHYVATLFYFA